MTEAYRVPVEKYMLQAVMAAGEALYHWDLATDRMTWSDNAMQLLGVTDPRGMASGHAFEGLLEGEGESRLERLLAQAEGSRGRGGTFRMEYALRPGSASAVPAYVEDSGYWHAGPDGRPAHVFGVVRRIDERRRLKAQLELYGQHDPLTGLINRTRLNQILEETVAAATLEAPVAFVLARIDNLDVIADAYGHEMADHVLRVIGRRLRRVARGEDVVARYADDRFALLLHDCREEDLKVAMGRFLSVVNERMIDTGDGPVWGRMALGGVLLPQHANSRDAALAAAEEALAEACAQPVFRGMIYQPAPNRLSRRVLNARCAGEIVEALRSNRFTLAFQPIVDARNERPVMHEALLRLRARDGEVLAAGHLIPVAEKLGLIRLVDYSVLELAADVLQKDPAATLTVNISGTTAMDASWRERIRARLEEMPDVAARLVIEMAESALASGRQQIAAFLADMRALGVRIAIDRFGMHNESHGNLKQLPIDFIKLDGAFCENLGENPENQYFIRALVDEAHSQGVQVVAEWVQGEADAAMLRDWGVDYLQGHLFGAARIDDPWASPSLEGRPGVLSLIEPEEELADLGPEIVIPSPPAGSRRPATPAAPAQPARAASSETASPVPAPAASSSSAPAGEERTLADGGSAGREPEDGTAAAAPEAVQTEGGSVLAASLAAPDAATASAASPAASTTAQEKQEPDTPAPDRTGEATDGTPASTGEVADDAEPSQPSAPSLEAELEALRHLLDRLAGKSGESHRPAKTAAASPDMTAPSAPAPAGAE